MNEEPHHHLVLQNSVVKVFEVELPARDAFLMHRHDTDDVAIVLSESATVSTAPGQADVLTMSKVGDVRFARSGRIHSVRNIGRTAHRMILIGLLQPQTGARNLCGTQVPESTSKCPAAAADANAPSSDVPQFETDEVRVTLTRVRPHAQANFGDAGGDDLIVTIDDAVIVSAAGAGTDQPLATGEPVWIAHGGAKRILRNNSEKDLRVVTVAFKP